MPDVDPDVKPQVMLLKVGNIIGVYPVTAWEVIGNNQFPVLDVAAGALRVFVSPEWDLARAKDHLELNGYEVID